MRDFAQNFPATYEKLPHALKHREKLKKEFLCYHWLETVHSDPKKHERKSKTEKSSKSARYAQKKLQDANEERLKILSMMKVKIA